MNGYDALRMQATVKERNEELANAISDLQDLVEQSLFHEEHIVDLMRKFPCVDALYFKRLESTVENLKHCILHERMDSDELQANVHSYRILSEVLSDLTELKEKKEVIVKKTMQKLTGGN